MLTKHTQNKAHPGLLVMALQDDEDTVLSLKDVLEEDKELEDTANAVLGDSQDSECSYSKVCCCFSFLTDQILSYFL